MIAITALYRAITDPQASVKWIWTRHDRGVGGGASRRTCSHLTVFAPGSPWDCYGAVCALGAEVLQYRVDRQ